LSSLDLAGVRDAEPESAPQEIVLDVVYDGPDLGAIAAETGLPRDEVIARHARGGYVVAFCGFAPGFGYLTGLDRQLHVPRLSEPRTRVPAGAVGIAGEFTGVYPRPSPGGWRLVGRTAARLWDVDREPPSLLVPGARVRFRPA
jgi:KipI family sensor histidine kinase inhibitor